MQPPRLPETDLCSLITCSSRGNRLALLKGRLAMTSFAHILVDEPRPRVRRITLNRPEKRNALNNLLRKEIFEALEAADRDPAVSIMILRGAGTSFSSGYDLAANNAVD